MFYFRLPLFVLWSVCDKGMKCISLVITSQCFRQTYISLELLIDQGIPVNSYPPCAAYMRQWTGSALVQVMACLLTTSSNYLNQCCHIVKLPWNSNKNSSISIQEKIRLKMPSGKWRPSSSWGYELTHNGKGVNHTLNSIHTRHPWHVVNLLRLFLILTMITALKFYFDS